MLFPHDKARDEKVDLELAHHYFCVILLDKAITWLNPHLKGKYILPLNAKEC